MEYSFCVVCRKNHCAEQLEFSIFALLLNQTNKRCRPFFIRLFSLSSFWQARFRLVPNPKNKTNLPLIHLRKQ